MITSLDSPLHQQAWKRMIYRFAEFELDESTRELRRGGEQIVVQPLVFDLLLLLVRNHLRVVSKNELIGALWPDTFVTEASLQRTVSLARTALDDDAHVLIRTFVGHGYRFCGDVNEQPPAQARSTGQETRHAAQRALAGAHVAIDAKTQYAKSGDVHIAYRVFGEGPRDIVLIPGTLSHVELYWEFPTIEYLLKRLTSFARVIVFDKRGQGLSDRGGEQTLEERVGDVRAVMDAAGSRSATIYGWSEGGPMSIMFAATYPERTSALVLCGTHASMKADPWAVSPELYEQFLGAIAAHWGEGIVVFINAPSRVNDKAFVEWFGRLERAAASPGDILALFRANYEIDVRHILPSIQVPTLILHRNGDTTIPEQAGRYLAQHIPGARYVELPGGDHMLQAFDQDVLDLLLDETEEFITGTHHRPEPDRVLATVMFTDIVSSTERAAELGDRRWRALLSNYYAAVRKELAAFRGREVNTTGDGLLATFDGPARAIRCAGSMRERVRPLGLQVRTGLHTGECELIGDDVGGIAVHIGARVAAAAGPGEVLVSGTVKDLVAGSGIEFEDRGSHELKGVPEAWRLFLARA